jgi:sulfur-oxidizing protein SoxX
MRLAGRLNLRGRNKRRDNQNSVKRLLLIALLAAQGAVASDSSIEQGKALTFERGKGNCLACHSIEDGELPGNLGPPLLAMKLRFPERENLKRQICDATIRDANTRMPPFCRHGILNEEEVELIIDYLYTL